MASLVPLEEGHQAYRHGKSLIDNPYARYSDEWRWWELGWKDEWWDRGEVTWRPAK